MFHLHAEYTLMRRHCKRQVPVSRSSWKGKHKISVSHAFAVIFYCSCNYRMLVGSNALDMKQFSILKGKFCWVVHVDLLVRTTTTYRRYLQFSRFFISGP